MSSRRSRDVSPVDRISNLPEPIITEILNLVPTKEAVATSLLSKSWRRRWKEVATIDLALDREPGVKFTVLPSEIYSFRTLEVLKLDGDFTVDFPDAVPVCLPKLTELVLNWVAFVSSATVGKLISSCPVLQSLTVKKRRFVYFTDRVFTVSSISLKRLHICFIHEETRFRPLHMKLIVVAPALESLVLHDLVSMDISITSSVKEVDLDFRLPAKPSMVVGLLDTFRGGVEFLKLSYSTMRALKPAIRNLSGNFERLTKLVVSCCNLKCLVDLMDRCVNLQVLEIHSCDGPRSLDELHGLIRFPRCLSSSLRQVTFKLSPSSFHLDEKMIEFILNHGLVMETVTLCFHHGAHEFPMAETLQWVSRMHKASPICEIFPRIGNLGVLEFSWFPAQR